MDAGIKQHKRMAMGENIEMRRGGLVKPSFLKSGKKDSPLETAKRNNGIPGYKAGGDVKKKAKGRKC